MKQYLHRLSLSLVLVVCTVQGAFGQAPTVVASAPVDRATGVPLTSTVSFVFSSPIGANSFVGASTPSIRPQDMPAPVMSADSTTLSYTITHEPDTDYTWVVRGWHFLNDCEGEIIPQYTLRYTTADAFGEHTVRGGISVAAQAAKVAAGPPAAAHRNAAAAMLRAQWDRHAPQVESDGGIPSPDQFLRALARETTAGRLTGTVALRRVADEVDPGTGRPVSVLVDVVEVEADVYAFDAVRPGRYVLRAETWEEQADGSLRGLYGTYDPDGDMRADTIEVGGGGGSTALETAITVYDYADYLYTAREREDQARARARAALEAETGSAAGELHLVGLWGGGEDGKSFWSYTFYSPVTSEYGYLVSANSSGLWSGETFEAYVYAWYPPQEPLPQAYVDTDAVMAAVTASPRVSDFLARYPEWWIERMEVMTRITQDNPISLFGDRPVWKVRFIGSSPEMGAGLECRYRQYLGAGLDAYVDVRTGEVLAAVVWDALGFETARAHEAVARAALATLVGDEGEIELLKVDPQSGWGFLERDELLAGLSTDWQFIYRVSSGGCAYVTPGNGGQLWLADSCPSDLQPIAEEFVDSGEALGVALGHGGDAFLERFPDADLTPVVGGTSQRLKELEPGYDGRPVWEVYYRRNGSPSGELGGEFRMFVDMATGEVVYEETAYYNVAAEAGDEVPKTLELGQNYPNPFNPSTTITFALPKPGRVTVEVFDLTGRLLETLVDEWRTAGAYTVRWEAAGRASGLYLYRIQAGGSTHTRSMVLLK